MNDAVKLMTKDELTKALGAVGKQVALVTKSIQTLAVQAIGYSLIHGDITIGQRLLDNCNKSIRKDSLVKYLENFGAFAWDKTGKKFVHHKRGSLKFDQEYVELLNSNPWNAATREPEIKSKYDVDQLFGQFIDKVRKLAANPSVTLANKELIAVLEVAERKWYDAKLMAETKAPEPVEIPAPTLLVAAK